MTDKELKKMTRGELLELLIEQMEENERLKVALYDTQMLLDERKIVIENSGTMAEAALKLNKVFEAADAAAKQYIESLYHLADERKQKNDEILEEKEEADGSAECGSAQDGA